MPNVVELPSFYLKKGVSEAEFLQAHAKFHEEFVSRQKGYISHKLLVQSDKWSDLVIWETKEDSHNAFKAIYESAVALEYMKLIDDAGSDDEIPLFTVVKSY